MKKDQTGTLGVKNIMHKRKFSGRTKEENGDETGKNQ